MINTRRMHPTDRPRSAGTPRGARGDAARTGIATRASTSSQRPSSAGPVRPRRASRSRRPVSAAADLGPERVHRSTHKVGGRRLQDALLEMEPPYGVLRLTLLTEREVEEAKAAIAEGLAFLRQQLPAAVGGGVRGPAFQALLAHAGAAPAVGSPGTLYATRQDRAGGAELRLAEAEVAGLSAQAHSLVAMLRIKLEDDGDLELAQRALAECEAILDAAAAWGAGRGLRPAEALSWLRDGAHGAALG